jgi:hypothetical protein
LSHRQYNGIDIFLGVAKDDLPVLKGLFIEEYRAIVIRDVPEMY